MACLILVQYDEFTVFKDELHVLVPATTVSRYTCCKAEHSKQNAGWGGGMLLAKECRRVGQHITQAVLWTLTCNCPPLSPAAPGCAALCH